MQPAVSPPASIQELFDRASALAGVSFADLAIGAGVQVPKDLRRDKGWVGQLLELYLGASSGAKQQQDFPELGVELKTLPINELGKPLETTFVCTTPLLDLHGLTWANSNVRNKLQCVLWLPIDGRREIPLAQRTVGGAFIWRPSDTESAALQADWQEHMDRIAMGEIEQITARQGHYLQLRPKAANGRVVTPAIGPNGQVVTTRPRGFYLKTSFTHKLLCQAYDLPWPPAAGTTSKDSA